jgi:hypothetical protein
VNATAYNAEIYDCGTIFTASGASGTTTLNLPTIAQAGKGWWCKVIKTGAAAAGGTIVCNSDAADGTTAIKGINLDDAADLIAHDVVTIANGADPGAQFEIVCDGEGWYILGFAVASADIAGS